MPDDWPADVMGKGVALVLASAGLASLVVALGPEIVAALTDGRAEAKEAQADDSGQDEYDDSAAADAAEDDEMDMEDETEGTGW
jgi:hypothetical protein